MPTLSHLIYQKTILIASLLFFQGTWPLAVATPGTPSPQHHKIIAQVELLNSKMKMRNGKIDQSGVVMWLEPIGVTAHGSRPRQKLNQRGKRFVPHVMVVEKGTEVDFPNSDPFFHNVFSLFEGKRFDLGLYASGESRPVLFNRVGISYIFCNIHPMMSAVILTVETPYFAISDVAGNLSLSDLPAGRYQLKVWHERTSAQELAAQTKIIEVSPVGTVNLGTLRINEAGYIPQPHPNKHGHSYDDERKNPLYKR